MVRLLRKFLKDVGQRCLSFLVLLVLLPLSLVVLLALFILESLLKGVADYYRHINGSKRDGVDVVFGVKSCLSVILTGLTLQERRRKKKE